MKLLERFRTSFLLVGLFFATLISQMYTSFTPVFAAPNTQETIAAPEAQNNQTNQSTVNNQGTTQDEPVENPVENPQTSDETSQNPENNSSNNEQNTDNSQSSDSINTCYDESGSLGWLVCPTTGFLAKITDSIYNIIEDFLVITPISFDSDSPYHQIWSIFRDITNIVFVIFFLVIIYSQITGLGFSNYNIKKALPKVIVSAILINLSFIICALLVDVSNIAGASIRGLFSSIEESITATGIVASASNASSDLSYVAITTALTGGTAIAGIAAATAGGLGYIFFSLVAILLGAVVSILVAFVTIATRQAFVYILIMLSPLAFVCYLLPNTEPWFKKWKSALIQMLFFYPIFAALFGACSLIGWVIIAAAENPLMIILGMGVKVVPLFIGWNLLKLSGTIPGQVGAILSGFTKKPLGGIRALTNEQANLRRAKYYGNTARPHQYNRRLAQFVQEQQYKRIADTKMYTDASIVRAQAKTTKLTSRKGKVTKRAVEIQSLQTQNLLNQASITRSGKYADDGLSSLSKPGTREHQKLLSHDLKIMRAADQLAMETSDAETIRYNNAVGRSKRFTEAVEAHVQSSLYGKTVSPEALTRYNRMLSAARGNHDDTRFIAAEAAQFGAVETKVRSQKFDTYFRTLPPTQHLYDQLVTMTGEGHENAENIDTILNGVRAIGQRGDTDLVKDIIDRVVESGQIKLGSHASQSLANYLMFEMGGKDVLLRRYGKYINLETARVYNEGQSGGKRINDTLSFSEYIRGDYIDYVDSNGTPHIGKSKRSASILLEGTSLDDVERTAYANIDASLRKAYTDENGVTDIEGFKKKRAEFQKALLPAFISAGGKYLSGSEQIQNAAEFLTGLHLKNGVYEKRWEKDGDSLFGLDADYFQKQTNTYILAQTPTQILNLRTDIFNPVVETLATEKEKELREAGKLPDGYDSLNDTEKKNARLELAKEKFQELLDSKGKLETIYRSRTSGAANNAKDIIRDFLDFNDEGKINKFLKKRRQERQLRQQIYEETHGDTPSELPSIFDENDRQYFQDRVFSLLDQNPDSDSFYTDSLRMVREEFGQEFIARRYEDFYRNNPTATNTDLLSTITDLLSNPENY